MALIRIRRLQKIEDLIQLKNFITTPLQIPINYFLHECECYGIYVDYELKASYCIKYLPLDDMKVIQQIPRSERLYNHEDPFKYAEITNITIKDPKCSYRLYLNLFMNLLRHKASYFIYSYLTEDMDTRRLFSSGNPLRLYSGKSCVSNIFLPVSINVEMISKFGVFKILITQFFSYLSTKLKI